MNLSNALLATGWLIRITIRQSFASKLFWVMLTLSTVCMLFCLGVGVKDGERLPTAPDEVKQGLPANDPIAKKLGQEGLKAAGLDMLGGDELSLGFGAFTITTNRGREDSVRFLQVWLAGLVAGTAGIFLTIIWTAGFLPTFLDPTQVTVLIAKPVPRWSLLFGKVIGVLVFVGFQTTFFVVGTWLALGISTGVYDIRYLLAIPVLLLHFSVFYSFSVMLAVWTRSTVVCVFGTLLFWVLCWGMNFGRHAVVANEPKGISPASLAMLDIGYWALPKPGDLNIVLDDALDTQAFSASVPEFEAARKKNRINLPLSVLACLLFSGWMFGVAAWEFRQAEY
ncbi:ABC transporter permease [Zavarzinella formosa]|uniref:ABC transporter permease n=1 Tax=Zavarzinella formosa TaxID=360055 RepID=UPI0002EAE92A|nr:ABC transporter permease subunit [Zavarzinella formosa]